MVAIHFPNLLLSSLLLFALPAASPFPHTISLPITNYFKATCSLPPQSQSSLLEPILISKYGSFAWGFTSSPSDGLPFCSLSIVCYHCKRYYPVWSASSRHHTGAIVSGALILQLGTNRDLELRDASASLLWSSNTGGVASIELLDVGNLVMLDSANSTVWQSFEHPSNVLLPGQILTPGMRLIAGDYSAVMEAGGLAFYVNSPDPLPYLVLNSSWALSIVDKILHPLCKGLSLVYATEGDVLTMQLDLSNGSAAPDCSYKYLHTSNLVKSNLSVTALSNSSGFRYLKLESTGEFKTFLDEQIDFSWFQDTDDSQGRGYCNLPNYCGEYSICFGAGLCRCTDPSANQSSDYFISPDYTVEPPETNTCSMMEPVNCTQTSTNAIKILRLQDLDYFPHRYMSSPTNGSTLQDCVQSCEQNCSCVVAFYNNQTQACHHYSKTLSMQRITTAGRFLVFLKIVPQMARTSRGLKFVVIAVIVGTSLFASSLILILWMHLKYRRKTSTEQGGEIGLISRSEDDTFLDSIPGLPPRYTVEQLHQITNGFSVMLGTGGFGSVYEGTLPEGSKIAVKKLEGTGQGVKEFRAEVAAPAGLSHVNLVQLRISNESEPATLLDWQTRFQIAIDAARGLAFLHGESRDRIFHLDVKPQNILLDDKFMAKLSDFGLAKLMERGKTCTMTSMRGTPGYLAPEWLLQMSVTDKSDVYSFGMLLMEVVSGRRNVDYSSPGFPQ